MVRNNKNSSDRSGPSSGPIKDCSESFLEDPFDSPKFACELCKFYDEIENMSSGEMVQWCYCKDNGGARRLEEKRKSCEHYEMSEWTKKNMTPEKEWEED